MYTTSIYRSYCTNGYANVYCPSPQSIVVTVQRYANVYCPSPQSIVVTVQMDMLMITAAPLSLS